MNDAYVTVAAGVLCGYLLRCLEPHVLQMLHPAKVPQWRPEDRVRVADKGNAMSLVVLDDLTTYDCGHPRFDYPGERIRWQDYQDQHPHCTVVSLRRDDQNQIQTWEWK